MAREVGLGKPYNATCDIYSFSILLAQMLTGEIPYPNLSTIRQIQNQVWNEWTHVRPNLDDFIIPESLQYMMEQAWSADIQRRPKLIEIKNFLMDEMRHTPAPKKVMEWLTKETSCSYCQRMGVHCEKGKISLREAPKNEEPALFFVK